MLPSARPILLLCCAAVLAGCGTTNPCRVENPEYVNARERPKLQMPEGVTGSERLQGGSLVIPPASPTPDKLEPPPRCLDEPPSYTGKPVDALKKPAPQTRPAPAPGSTPPTPSPDAPPPPPGSGS